MAFLRNAGVRASPRSCSANGGTIGGIDKSVKKAYNRVMPFIVVMLSIPVICRLMVLAGDALGVPEPAPEKKP